MSKRASAFERTATHRAAGQIAPAASRTCKEASEYSYDKAVVRYSSFILPVPQLFRPSAYLAGVHFEPYESEGYYFPLKVFKHVEKYVESTIKPWLVENEITKYRIYHLNEHGPHDVAPHEDMVYSTRKSIYLGAGIIFKNPNHRLLFKLTF